MPCTYRAGHKHALTSSSGDDFFSFSGSTLTRTTPDLSTTSWISFPLFPITFPGGRKQKISCLPIAATARTIHSSRRYLMSFFNVLNYTSADYMLNISSRQMISRSHTQFWRKVEILEIYIITHGVIWSVSLPTKFLGTLITSSENSR